MGDVVGLVEKAAATMDAEKAEKIAARMKKGLFTLEDMLSNAPDAQGRKSGAGHVAGHGQAEKQRRTRQYGHG